MPSAPADTRRRPPWHTLSAEDVLGRLGSGPEGLDEAEAERRLSAHGPNELRAPERTSAWRILLAQLRSVLIAILLVGTALSAFLGHGIEAIAIAVIVLFAVLLGFVQEFRAERAIEALRRMAAPSARVVRGGREREVPARTLVPGDVLVVRAGDRIPADGRILEAFNMRAEESALTGESLAAEKDPEPIADEDAALGDRRNVLHMGTTAAYGRCRAVVVATGMATEFGRIAEMLESVESGRTPLQENLDAVGRALAKLAFLVVALVVVLGLVRGQPVVEMLVFGIALAVAVVPEALPAVVTISLAIGVQRMVKRNALVRRLAAVETLGSTSVICSDKTGTLTRDEMTARRLHAGDEVVEVSGVGYEPRGGFARDGTEVGPSELVGGLLRAAALASDARLVRDEDSGAWTVEGDPTEGALVVAAAKAGIDRRELDGRYPRVDEIPFTSEAKRMTVFCSAPEGVVAFAKGAPEAIVPSCARRRTERGDVELDDRGREAALAAARGMGEQALRVLAVASKDRAERADAERDMTLLGLVGMIDPPRPEARLAIETCERAGIRVVMITGDHPATAAAVARELGVLETGRLVTGPELEEMEEAVFADAVEGIDVYSRVSPEHKLRVVGALQERGHVVAMTGDGVNDAPALKAADIGIAMGITGTDVTKEAASMTLTDDNFASIVAAVEEGRAIYGNIKKYLMYLLSSNIGEIGLMAGTSVLGMPLPLTAVQILYVNLATDGLPALALSVDPHEEDLMRRPPRPRHAGIFTRPIVSLMSVGGAWSAAVNLGIFAWALDSGRSTAEAMTMTFVSLVLIQFFKAYAFRSDRNSTFRRPFANKWLNLAIAWELVLLGLVVYLPALHGPFGTFSLPLEDWLVVLPLSLTVLPVLELAKWMARRGWLGRLVD